MFYPAQVGPKRAARRLRHRQVDMVNRSGDVFAHHPQAKVRPVQRQRIRDLLTERAAQYAQFPQIARPLPASRCLCILPEP